MEDLAGKKKGAVNGGTSGDSLLEAIAQQLAGVAEGQTRLETESTFLLGQFLDQLQTLSKQVSELNVDASSSSGGEVDELRRERDALRAELETARQAAGESGESEQGAATLAAIESMQQELDSLRLENERLQQGSETGNGNQALIVEMSRLEEERDSLREQLDIISAAGDPNEQVAELRERLDMALGDLREARGEIERLESAGPVTPVAGGGGDDWESQKQRLLAQLADEGAGASGEQKKSLLSMEQVVRATDDAIKEKEREIEELKTLLDQQSSNISGFAVGAAAIEEILNHDELIQQERESLEKIKQEWREKLSKAEIEVSMERARLARERKELEAQVELLQQEKQRLEKQASQAPDAPSEPAQKNRWLNRLGLSDKS